MWADESFEIETQGYRIQVNPCNAFGSKGPPKRMLIAQSLGSLDGLYRPIPKEIMFEIQSILDQVVAMPKTAYAGMTIYEVLAKMLPD